MARGIGLAGAAGAAGAVLGLDRIIEQRLLREKFDALNRAQDEQREERAFNRQRLIAQDERQRQHDAEARLAKQTERALKLAELYPGARMARTALGDMPSDVEALVAKSLEPTVESRSITGFASMPGARQPAGAVTFEEHEAVAPGTVELQEPISATRRAAAERQAAIDANAAANRDLAERRLEEQRRHNQQMEALRLLAAGRTGTGRGTVAPESLDAVADLVLRNPDLLDDFTPTVKSQILSRMATRGGEQLRNQRADSTRSMIDTALSTIERLQDPETAGMSGAVGVKGPMSMFGLLDKPIAGSSAANYRALADTLKAQLTLPELQKLRGLGAMSDREFATLSRAATSLSTDQSEDEFVAELGRIATTLRAVKSRLPDAQLNADDRVIVDDPRGAVPVGGARGTATRGRSGDLAGGRVRAPLVRMRAPNGAEQDVPADQVEHYKARGAKVVR